MKVLGSIDFEDIGRKANQLFYSDSTDAVYGNSEMSNEKGDKIVLVHRTGLEILSLTNIGAVS